jgi:prepilin-type processing-associated H-X9-DG protein
LRAFALGVTLTLLSQSLVVAQDLAPVKPFLDDKTIAIVDVDVAQIDLNAFEAQAVRSMEADKADAAQVQQMRTEMRADLQRAQKWLDALKAAKADRALVLVGMPQQMGPSGPSQLIIVPVADDAAAAAVEKTIDEASTTKEGQPPSAKHERIGNAVVVGESEMLASLKTLKPADRPDLAAAHAQAVKAGDGAIRVAFAPTGPMRAMVMMAADPVSANRFNTGLQTLGLSIGLPPSESLNLNIKSKDAASATAFVDWVDGFLQSGAAPVDLSALQPTATGDTVTLSLDKPAVTKLVDDVVPSLLRARQTAVAVQSASNIRQLLMMAMVYSNANKGKLPETLEALRTADVSPEQFAAITTNPQRPDARPGYIYLKPREDQIAKIKNAPGRALIHEAFDGPFPAAGVNVGFVDGHVEMVRDEAKFNELLNAAK